MVSSWQRRLAAAAKSGNPVPPPGPGSIISFMPALSSTSVIPTHPFTGISTPATTPTAIPTPAAAFPCPPNKGSVPHGKTKTMANTGAQTSAPPCTDVESDDDIQYIKTVYPVETNVDTGTRKALQLGRSIQPHATRQLRMDDFFTPKNPKFANFPPSLLAALAKSDAVWKTLTGDFKQLKQDIAELWDLKGEADILFEALEARFKPLIASSPIVATGDNLQHSPSATSSTTSNSAHTPAGDQSASETACEPSDQQYLITRSARRLEKRRATSPSRKRRASQPSVSTRPAKKPRIDN